MKTSRLSEKLAEAPDNLLNAVKMRLHLKNDAALARALGVKPLVISKIRHRKLSVGSAILVRMLEAANSSIRELHALSMRLADSPIEAAPEKATRKGGGKRVAHDEAMYGIFRRNGKRRDTHSSSWHVCITRMGVTYSKVFSDSRHGGEQGAFELAVQARQRFLEEMEGHVLHSPAARLLQARMESDGGARANETPPEFPSAPHGRHE